jgi:cytochrome P450
VRAAVDTIDARIARMIADRRAAGLHRNDLLTQLLRARGDGDGATMSDRQVRDQAVNLFIGGHETTATGIAWAIHELAKAPATYARVQAEADRFAGRTPTREELPQLSTCMRVFKESLRMYPPVYAYGRQALTEVSIGGYDVPAGTAVLASAYGLHHNPAVYPNPERFDPDRFAPEADAARHRSAWVPFGNGPRICIGNHFGLLEGQLVLAALSHRVQFEARPGADVHPEPAATLRPNGGMPMIARIRNGAHPTSHVPQQSDSKQGSGAANEH